MENLQSVAEALARLQEPFASRDVKWLVAATSRDGRKGRVTPYADRELTQTGLTTSSPRVVSKGILRSHRLSDHTVKERQAHSDRKGSGHLCRVDPGRRNAQRERRGVGGRRECDDVSGSSGV